jgi:hypothetical protein
MIHFLTTQSIWVSGGIIVGIGTVLSVLGPVLLRRYARAKRSVDTDIAGFKFGTIGVLYAVLLAFAIIVVWEKFSDAELKAVQEAGAAENVYRLSQGLSDNARVAVVNGVANYLKAAINVEWPAMDQGYPVRVHKGVGNDVQRVRPALEQLEGRVHVRRLAHLRGCNVEAERPCRGLSLAHLQHKIGTAGIG